MNIQELILELKKHDPKKMVVIRGYEGGRDEVKSVSETRIKLNTCESCYYGRHEEDDDGDCCAVFISWTTKSCHMREQPNTIKWKKKP